VASALTNKDVDDGAQVGSLLDQVPGSLSSFTGDGAYDQDGVYAGITERHPEAVVIVPPRSTAVPSDTAATAPTQRDGHLKCVAEKGRMAWQKTSGYNRRAKAEAAVGRSRSTWPSTSSTACWRWDARAMSATSNLDGIGMVAPTSLIHAPR
jgi:hypothetical protein